MPPSPFALQTAARALDEGFAASSPEVALGLGVSLASLLREACARPVVLASDDELPASSGAPTIATK